MSSFRTRFVRFLTAAVLAAAVAAPAAATTQPQGSAVAAKAFAPPDFQIRNPAMPYDELPATLALALAADLDALGASPAHAFYDLRAGGWRSLVLAAPMLPGAGNALTWSGLGLAPPAGDGGYGEAALQVFESYLAAHPELGVDLAELEAEPHVAVIDGRRLVQIWADREIDGIPVRGSSVSATLNSGNLILYNARNWGPIGISTTPQISRQAAEATVAAHAAPYAVDGNLRRPRLVLLPRAVGAEPDAASPGQGLSHHLAWSIVVGVAGDAGAWEGLVDAHSGELLSFTDMNHYLERRTFGGILPVSNDGQAPDGVEQPRHPMPYADLLLQDGSTVTTSAGGIADVDGAFATDLSGPYVAMIDSCGPIAESTLCTDLDLGTNAGTDCDVPATAQSAGNTRASRTGFYELNRLIEQGRSRTDPSDPASYAFFNLVQVPANMNLDDSCNAFFTPVGLSINFYTSGTVPTGSGDFVCRNTGEIAAVFDHEYGHFVDFMDGNGLSSSSEGYADAVSILRLNDTCVGRGFWLSNPRSGSDQCDGNGDLCLDCTGVRQADWKGHLAGLPHDVDWLTSSNPNIPGGCVAAPPAVPQPPPPGLSGAPCGGDVHCEGHLISESIVDLFRRDLRCDGLGWEDVPSATGHGIEGGRCTGDVAPTLDENTALEIATLLFYRAKGNIQAWFECSNQFGGCNADSGLVQFLAADDDNGNLADGTPHDRAIFDAFDRHQIACPALAPPPVDLSCPLGEPAKVTGLTVTPAVHGAVLDWDDAPGALSYGVYRAEGVLGCGIGKALVATTTASEYVDGGLLDGFAYYYTVLPVGVPGCYGRMSSCETVSPAGAGGGVQATASLGVTQGDVALGDGDGDGFLDNCETATVGFTVFNGGGVDLAGVEVVDVRPVSHPGTTVLTALPIALGDLANLCTGTGANSADSSFDFVAAGLAFDDILVFEVDVTAAGLGGTETAVFTVSQTESDMVFQSELTFDFENGRQDWETTEGVFDRTGAGAGGAPTPSPGTLYMASSSLTSEQCDQVRSAPLRLTQTSTIALFNQFDIEPETTAFYDRANVGIVDLDSGDRHIIHPDGGARPYNVPGGDEYGTCATTGQAGWAGLGLDWQDATWSAAQIAGDLAAGGVSIPAQGKDVRIDVTYGTDQITEGTGFKFDQVTLTDVYSRSADQGSDDCGPPPTCGDFDDADPAVEYRNGWHRRTGGGSGGGYHRHMGNNPDSSARLAFSGDQVTYNYVMSDRGGTANVYVDGSLVETLSYGAGQPGPENPTFGHSRTYSGLGAGGHELVIEHRSGAAYVDGFTVPCGGGSADPAAAGAHSETVTSTGSAAEGPLLLRTVEVGSLDEHLSAVVEGGLLPVTVRILDPAGALLAEGGSLLGGAASGAGAAVTVPGTYTVAVVNSPGAFDTVEISIARTVANP